MNFIRIGNAMLKLYKKEEKRLPDGGLDMTDVSFVTSAGLRVLIGLRKRMTPGAKLALKGVQPFVRHVLELSGLTALIGQ